MTDDAKALIDILVRERTLPVDAFAFLIDSLNPELADYAASYARQACLDHYGHSIYIRGLIEIGNYCKNNCLYCGIRVGNSECDRYRLSAEEILSCADEGYDLGFRTFVLQGGEDPYFSDEVLVPIIEQLKSGHPDCAVTLSLGERSRDSYQKLFDAGADRYLLRHETADPEHYGRLHPSIMRHDERLNCLRALKDIGYVVGSGFMVGTPYQTSRQLAQDLKLIEELDPEMCGIGPFISHHATPFADQPAGSAELTFFLISLLRIAHPRLLLPATTALSTMLPDGYERGILAGANVVMPNLTPRAQREKYELYEKKDHNTCASKEFMQDLEQRMNAIGRTVEISRGDPIRKEQRRVQI